jgi:hypothetical protein
MDEAKRKGLERLKEGLILAAQDMADANAAANALRTDTSGDEAWRRALETAMAVSYMRPFTKGAWRLPGKYEPKGGDDWQGLHDALRDLRNKVYAHSDEASGRSGTMTTKATDGDMVTIEYRSGWLAFPVSELYLVQSLCHNQAALFLKDAAAIHVELEEADA